MMVGLPRESYDAQTSLGTLENPKLPHDRLTPRAAFGVGTYFSGLKAKGPTTSSFGSSIKITTSARTLRNVWAKRPGLAGNRWEEDYIPLIKSQSPSLNP
jgi:hypothetical protein